MLYTIDIPDDLDARLKRLNAQFNEEFALKLIKQWLGQQELQSWRREQDALVSQALEQKIRDLNDELGLNSARITEGK